MRRYIYVATAGLYFIAAGSAWGAGGTAAAFMRIGIGARNVAMGEIGTAEQDANAVYWNPAGLLGIEKRSISFMHAAWLEDISLQNASYAQRIGEGVGAITATYLSVPEIQKYDNTGLQEDSSFKPSDTAIWVSYARAINNVPWGASIRYIRSEIDGRSASAVAADIGAQLLPMQLAGRDLRDRYIVS